VAKLIRFVARFGFLSGFRWLQSVLKKPEHYRELQELQPVSSLQEHFFTRLRDARGLAHQTLSLLRLQPLFGDLQGGIFVALDHRAKLGRGNVLNYTAGFFDPGAEFFRLDHFLGRGGERVNDRLGRADGHERSGPAVEIISFDP
jgi:hypothetical protein